MPTRTSVSSAYFMLLMHDVHLQTQQNSDIHILPSLAGHLRLAWVQLEMVELPILLLLRNLTSSVLVPGAAAQNETLSLGNSRMNSKLCWRA